jgi:hypothetical protein
LTKAGQNDVNIAAGIEAMQIEAITMSVLGFRLAVIRAASE